MIPGAQRGGPCSSDEWRESTDGSSEKKYSPYCKSTDERKRQSIGRKTPISLPFTDGDSRLEGTKRVKMLIDSGSERCVMSNRLWDELQDELPINRDVAWSIGFANTTRDQVYGICHSVSVNVGGVEVDAPIFVLE